MSLRNPGILLVNLGTPDTAERKDVNRYLLQFLTDKRVIDFPWLKRQLLVRGLIVPMRAGNSTSLYKQLWTEQGSPLKYYGEQLSRLLEKRLGGDIAVALGMRYQNPSIEAAIDELIAKDVDEIIVFPLFPHYASASTGSAFEEVMRVISQKQVIPSISFIQDYYDHDDFLKVVIDHSRPFDLDSYDHVLFSYHGIPERHLIKANSCGHCLSTRDCCGTLSLRNRHCYSAQSHATTRALVAKLGLSPGRYTTCFQSRLGKEVWTQPYASQVIEERAKMGDKNILVFSPSFVADCLETTVEVGIEYQEEFVAAGGRKLDLVPSLNDDPQWVEAIVRIIQDRVKIDIN